MPHFVPAELTRVPLSADLSAGVGGVATLPEERLVGAGNGLVLNRLFRVNLSADPVAACSRATISLPRIRRHWQSDGTTWKLV